MDGNHHLEATSMPASLGLVYDEDKSLHERVDLMNLASVQMQINNEECGTSSQTGFYCSLCKKSGMTITELMAHRECCAPNLNETSGEVLAARDYYASNSNLVCDNEPAVNSRSVLYFCLTCAVGSISFNGLSEHQQCMVTTQKTKFEPTDHSYTKIKPLVMNYLLTQQETSIHIKCFKRNGNQPEMFSCSLCCSKEKMLNSKACEHVKLLTDSVLLNNQVEKESPSCNSSLLCQKASHIENKMAGKKMHYMCVTCGKLYTKQSSLVQHMKSHTVEPSTCPHCSKVFMSLTMLNTHLNVHGVFPYKCAQCSKMFLLEPLLSKHLATEHSFLPDKFKWGRCNKVLSTKKRLMLHDKTHSTAFKCSKCKKTFTSETHMDLHLKSHNNLCSMCGKKFLTQAALMSHEKSHITKHAKPDRLILKDSNIICDICGVMVQKSLKKHIIRHHSENNSKTFVCETCGAAFWERSELGVHQTMHSEERPFSCSLCNATFKRRNYLTSHLLSVHNKLIGSILDPCVTCGVQFKTKKDKAEHLKTHSSTVHTCNICDKNLPTRMGLYLHHKYIHEKKNDTHSKNLVIKSVVRRAKQEKLYLGDTPPFFCNLCEKTYDRKTSLYQHRRNIHFGGNRKYPCKVCGKIYIRAVSLYAHMNIHNKKEFSCPVCSKVFLWQASFRHHIASHSDIKKHHCEYCDKSFHRRFLLDVHTRTHTGEKPYVCEICDKAFSQINDRKRHRMKHFSSTVPNKVDTPCIVSK